MMAQYSGGDGTQGNPYLISSLSDLETLSNTPSDWDKFFLQMNNINASATSTWNGGLGFSPIGNSVTNFTGGYDGAGSYIFYLTINRPNQDYVGLFGWITSAVIENVVLIDVSITGRDNVGGLLGLNQSPSVNHCLVTGNVQGQITVGGLIGFNSGGVFACYHKGNVSGSESVGGFLGRNFYSYVSNCFSIGNVSGNHKVGGFAGDINYYSISNSYAVGTVTSVGAGDKGGFFGFVDGGTTFSSYYDSDVALLTDANGNSVATTTLDMKNVTNYSGWDFSDTWEINACKNNGYPFLKNLYIDFTYPEAPLGPANQNFCVGATVADLEAVGTDITWFIEGANEEAILLSSVDVLESGYYFATQTIFGCTSNEILIVSVTVDEESTTSTIISECDTYTWGANNQTYTTSGTYVEVSGCTTTELVLTITPSTTNVTSTSACGSYTWGVNDETYTSSNSYTVVNGCHTEELELTILPNPDVTTTVTNETITANLANATYQWIDCNNANAPISGATNQSYTATTTGSYAVEITENGCTAASSCVSLTILGISENGWSSIQLYPNPANDHVMLQFNQFGELQVLSIEGKLMDAITINDLNYLLTVSHLTKGVYLLRFATVDGQIYQAKFVKE